MNDILKSINLRLSNPFILSFCLSWIFWNWPIVVGLIWYNSQTLNLYGYVNYKELIYANSDFFRNYFYPTCFAILFPYLKLGFSALQTLVNAIDERNIKNISRKGYISTSKFLDFKDQYEKDIQRLSKVIEEESEFVQENLNLKSKLFEVENSLVSEKQELERLQIEYGEKGIRMTVSSIQYFVGKWTLRLNSHEFENGEINEEIIFSKLNSKTNPNLMQGKNEEETINLTLLTYVFNPYSRDVALYLKFQKNDFFTDEKGDYIWINFGNLRWNSNFTVLRGIDSHSANEEIIELKKLD